MVRIAIGATDIANDPLGFGGYGYNASDATEATGDNAIAFGGGAKALAIRSILSYLVRLVLLPKKMLSRLVEMTRCHCLGRNICQRTVFI